MKKEKLEVPEVINFIDNIGHEYIYTVTAIELYPGNPEELRIFTDEGVS